MKTTIKLLTITICTLFLFKSHNTNAQCNNDDWYALKALYESTEGDSWTNRTGWNTQIANQTSPIANCDLSNLFGVSLNNNGRVVSLNLFENNLSGTISSELGNLSNLVILILNRNQLTSNIPSQLGNLTELEDLNLAGNGLTGTIPIQLTNFPKLEIFAVDDNQLSGEIPPEIGNLTSLTKINIAKNDFEGSIPIEIGDLINLNYFNAQENQLTGAIPSTIGNLTNLIQLKLESNDLTGPLPSELGNLINLTWLELRWNVITGQIPPEIGNLINLEDLYLTANQLTGNIPSELGNLINLNGLHLESNDLDGSIPTELGDLTNLAYLKLSLNDLNGSIPPELGDLTNLDWLLLNNNQLSGEIPDELGDLTNLTRLQLEENDLIGTIPASIGNLTSLNHLSLYSNSLEGSIPTEIGNLINLVELFLGFNLLTGEIPQQLWQLINLKNLWLADNQLTGSISSEICDLTSLIELQLFDNQLSGCYPDCMEVFCDQLINFNISGGNSFDENWEDFCATGAGECPPGNPVWPGDLNYDFIVNNQDLSISHLFMGENGPHRAPGGITWSAQACDNWGKNQPNGYDIKHHDCDGNGNINTNDANAIIINNGKTHAAPSGFAPPKIPIYTNTDFQILLQPINQVSPNSNIVIMNIVMDSKSGQNLEVFGGHFSIDYSSIVGDIDNVVMNFESLPWLGNPGIDLLLESWQNSIENTIEVGFTKTNGISSTGKGVIGKVTFLLNANNLNRSNSCENLLDVAITKIGSFNAQQDSLQIEEEFRTVNLGMSCCESFINLSKSTPFQNFYQSSGNIVTNGYLPIGKNQQVQYNANRVTLNEGFSVRAGADFKVRSNGCN